jgi:transposase
MIDLRAIFGGERSTSFSRIFCSGSNYCAQYCRPVGHEAKLISTHLVMAIRQNQKTDKNDALAIVQTSLLPDINTALTRTMY